MICRLSSKVRSERSARMWNSTSPGVAGASWTAPVKGRNGCRPAGLADAAGRIRSQYELLNPTTQDSGPLPIALADCRKPTARASPLMSEATSRSRSAAPGRSLALTTRKTAASLKEFRTACGSGPSADSGDPTEGVSRTGTSADVEPPDSIDAGSGDRPPGDRPVTSRPDSGGDDVVAVHLPRHDIIRHGLHSADRSSPSACVAAQFRVVVRGWARHH